MPTAQHQPDGDRRTQVRPDNIRVTAK